jgi:hypothetical protein
MAQYPYQEQLLGTVVSGVISAFNTTYVPIDNTLLLFENGLFQTINVDYLLSGNLITTTTPVLSTDDIRCSYLYEKTIDPITRNSVQETLMNNATAPTSLFTLSRLPITGTLNIFTNGYLQTAYNIVGQIIGFSSVIPVGTIVTAKYEYYGIQDTILPAGVKGSTTLNPVITSFDPLLTRIKQTLGFPVIEIEMCDDMIYDFINQAIEWYSKYAGLTEEYLVFSSDLYVEPGLRLDKLFSATPTMRELLSNGLSACYDYDLQDYRKVGGVFCVEQGESTGINTLFTLEQSMAQQTYFSYMLGNVGFDLVTWEIMKGWLKLREKVLAQIPYIDFDVRTQVLRIIPPPNRNSRYYGIVGCWVERTIRELVKERWVFQYALALTKISVANVRGKYGSVQLFGGGTINYNDLMSQGLQEKEKLEKELMEGYGEVQPARFWLG